ncbi:TM2 domain-containing protein [Hazenella sp. IB182357]|uniref:TM2 domain-containing protein n=1 Tax=Polycladospora coralii TaxID=2771432 RepID=A0A926NGJ0_9BACL|nr:TM2 domain-containing protein [Polycladospora coralii]MBD1373179.1 TM2 domain-containing protein [Polycladospora coralii]MBS7531736.1 TM2 domain-containing protein [Polycladospora coralii]
MVDHVFYKGKLYKKLDVGKMRILCALGFLCLMGIPLAGLHYFYKKNIFMGLLYFFTLGFFLVGTIYDFITMENKVLKHNLMVDEIIKKKEVEEAKRQGQMAMYKNMNNNVRTHIDGTIDL